VRPVTLKSNEAALKKAIAAISERLMGAKSVVALPALGCPFATTSMEKCLVDESHPQFVGLYAGAVSAPSTREIVEGADLVLDLGGVNLNDITTASYSAQLDPARLITIGLNDVRIGEKVIGGVRLADMLVELARLKLPAQRFRRTVESAPPIAGSDRTRSRWMRSIHATPPSSEPEIQSFLKLAVPALA
jgi:indolepyruvate decarboxylase